MARNKREPQGNAPGTNWRTESYKFDDIKKAAYLELLRAGGRRHSSARAVGISPQTIINHRESDPDFRAACDKAEMEADDEVEDGLRMAAISGNVTAALAWLYSRQPQRWSDMRKQQIEQINLDVSQLNDDQLARLARGDDLRSIIATASASGTGTAQADTETPDTAA